MRIEYDKHNKQVIFRMDESRHDIGVDYPFFTILQEQDLLMIRTMCNAALDMLYASRLTKIDDPIPLKSEFAKKGKR